MTVLPLQEHVKKVAQDEAVKSFVNLTAVAAPMSPGSPVCTPPRQKHPQVKSPLRSSPRLQQKTPVLTPPRQKHPEVTSPVCSSPRLHWKTPVCTPQRQKHPQVVSPVRSSPRLHQKTIHLCKGYPHHPPQKRHQWQFYHSTPARQEMKVSKHPLQVIMQLWNLSN